ncbi:NnrS family protein [Halomonas mongoliensis]|uniref:NnrS family protein n=1 Tax=Halomonas mongoliensis TaxID=321265 RepID=A0ABU1GMX5_9GAMM|nr:NnrS family protein [Halomonas mongoliensis]MDR5892907.1 NnrS family protein [Halomonas mongoliensis]
MLNPSQAATVPAWHLFFPLAALHGALLVPLSLLSLYHPAGVALLASPAAHGRELLFGFALAVIAGYLLGPLNQRWLWLLGGLWLAARLGGLLWPVALPVILADGAFVLLLGWRLVPRFIAAKRWRNRVLSPLLGLLCLLALVTLVWRYLGRMPTTALVMHQGVLWLVLLMTFMGGRVLAPAVNGYLMASRRQAGAGVQPSIEAALIVLLGTTPLLMLWPPLRPLAASLVLAAGLLVLLRLWRWRPWACRQRPDLLGLMLGYAWLGVGLLLLARAWWQQPHASATLHAFTIGALGALASGIMLRQAILRAKGRPEAEPLLLPLALLFSLAAVLRLLALDAGEGWLPLLWGSALAWSLAWLLAAWRLLHWRRRTVRRRLDPGQLPREGYRRTDP